MVSYLAYSSIVKMVEICSSKTVMTFTRLHSIKSQHMELFTVLLQKPQIQLKHLLLCRLTYYDKE
jgi:hypothetical protein